MQQRVVGIGGMRPVMLDEIAIQVHVVFGCAAQVRKAPGIDGMHHDHRHVRIQLPRAVAQHPCNLRRRAEKAFEPVCATDHQQAARRVGAAEAGYVGHQRLAVRRPGAGMRVLRQASPCLCGGCPELVARPAVVERVALMEFHGSALLYPYSACTVAEVDLSQNTSLRCRKRIRLVPVRPMKTRLNRQANMVATSILTEADWIR